MSRIEEDKLKRLHSFIGSDGIERLRQSFVCIVGLGAVGSYATEALVRSGVGHVRLVDCDEIRPTNFNRQLYALDSTVGKAKAKVAAQRIQDINPNCRVEPYQLFAHEETLDTILAGPPHLVIDAIDSVNPKVALLAGCIERNVPILSCMGAALRRDPSKIRIGSLHRTHSCPLARQIRKRLNRRGLTRKIPCVYSTETVHNLPASAVGPEEIHEQTLKRGRPRRSLGSLPTITGIFGLTIANHAIRLIIDD